MEPQTCKFVNTHDHEISGQKFLSRILHALAPYLGGMNGDVQSDQPNLAFKSREQLENFHIRMIRLQQEINLSVETVSPTRILFLYIKAL